MSDFFGKKVNVVTSGGGQQIGPYSIGVESAFAEYGINPEYRAATSSGALKDAAMISFAGENDVPKRCLEFWKTKMIPEILFGKEVAENWQNMNSRKRLNAIVKNRKKNDYRRIQEAISDSSTGGIDINKLKKSDVNFGVTSTTYCLPGIGGIIAGTLARSLRLGHYHNLDSANEQEIADAIMATNTNPYAFSKGVEIGNREHFDGGGDNQVPVDMAIANNPDADLTIVISKPAEAVAYTRPVDQNLIQSNKLLVINSGDFGPLPVDVFDMGEKSDELYNRGREEAKISIEKYLARMAMNNF